MKGTYTLLLLALVLFSCSRPKEDKLNVAVAANMQFAMEELEKVFESESGIDIEVILGSSGKLTAQIVSGAPYDVYLSADMDYPKSLSAESLSASEIVTYAFGRLVIWTSLDSSALEQLSNIESNNLKIAIANPKTAPYGRAAEQFLRSNNDWTTVQNQLVFGESVSQVNQFLLSGAAQVGFTSHSTVLTAGFKDKGIWRLLPENTYDPIAQGMVITTARPEMKVRAQRFFDFILSKRGQEILDKFGYSNPQNELH